MKRLALLAIFAFPVLMLASWAYWGITRPRNMSDFSAKQSVADRLQQFGPASRARLRPMFAIKQVPFPPARIVLLGVKDEKVLELYAAGADQQFRFIHSWPVLAGSGGAGPKLREGDLQVPEGIYSVESLNPNSKYHLSLRIGYPNQFDRAQARLEGRTNLGGDIMIHGGNASIGCLALGDEVAEDLFVLAADTGISNLTVILTPVDFRKGRAFPSADKLPRWTDILYQSIKTKLNELPSAN